MFELSPDDTAAKASASSIPALSSTSRSNPTPCTRSPAKSGLSRLNALLSLSMTATSWPSRDNPSATDDPTRPHPITTTRTCGSSRRACYLSGPTAVKRTVPAVPGGLTLGSRVQTFDCGASIGFGPAVSQRPAEPHTAAQADRLAGVRLRCIVVGCLRSRGGLPDALGGRFGGVLVGTVDRRRSGGGDAGRGGQLPAERACLPPRWRRLPGGHNQPGSQFWPHGGKRADGGLCSHGGCFDGIGHVEHRVRRP